MSLPSPKKERYTYADYLTWDDRARWELLEGAPYLNGEPYMSPAPRREHQRISVELLRQLSNFLDGKPCQVYHAPFDVRLSFGEEGEDPENPDTVVQPDLSVVCDPGKLDDTGCKGAPDMIVEISSPSTRSRDRGYKFDLYRCAGVREYWIVDPERRTVETFTLAGDGAYRPGPLGVGGGSIPVSVLEGCVVDLDRLFRRE